MLARGNELLKKKGVSADAYLIPPPAADAFAPPDRVGRQLPSVVFCGGSA